MGVYKTSTAFSTLKQLRDLEKPLRLAFLDLDGTWAGTSDEQQAIRHLLKEQGYVIAVVTSRTPEMCMSSSQRDITKPHTTSRPLFDSPAAPETMAEFQGLLDTDIIIGSSGTRLFLKQSDGGYRPDPTYEQRFPSSAEAWHARVNELLEQAHAVGLDFTVHRLALPNFRIEVKATTRQTIDDILTFLHRSSFASDLHLAREFNNAFITPAHTSKEDAVNHVLATLLPLLEMPANQVTVLLAGDSALDVPMGLTAGPGTQAVFLVPGGASVAAELIVPKETTRQVIIGDQVFPGTKGSQTLLAWLGQTHS